MGKWQKLKDALPRLQQEESNWQSQINAYKAALMEQHQPRPTMGQLGEEYNKARAEKDAINEQLSGVNLRLEGLTQLLIDHLEDAGLTSMRLEDGSTITLKDEPYSRVVDRPLYVSWIKANGMDDLLQVNFMSTNSIMKDRLESGEPIPPGVEVFMKTSIIRRK